MPTIDEPIDDPDARWARFRDALSAPHLRKGLEHAQIILDANTLNRLDAQLQDLRCEDTNCDFEATVAVYCMHGVGLIGLVCGAHHQQLVAAKTRFCAYCHHTGRPSQIWRFIPIFHRVADQDRRR